MPYASPAGTAETRPPPTPPKQALPTSSSSSTPATSVAARPSPHIRPSPTPSKHKQQSPRQIRRIPAPAILPPVVAVTHSRLHLTLTSEAGSTLSTQVDELLSRQLARRGSPGGDARAPHRPPSGPRAQQLADRHQGSCPPVPPPKTMRPSFAAPSSPGGGMSPTTISPPRRALPVPPTEVARDLPSHHPALTSQAQPDRHREGQYQHPATYGPSTSKIRTFQPQAFASDAGYNGLPPGAAGFPSLLGHGFPASRVANGYYGQLQESRAKPTSQPYAGAITFANDAASRPQDTVSRSFTKGGASILIHQAFYDLLSLSPYPSAIQGTQDQSSYPSQRAGWLGDRSRVPEPHRIVTSPNLPSRYEQASLAPAASPQRANRRISVDMISKPMGFTHLAHASDAEEAAELLTRWRIDGKGKLAEPAWVAAIKEAARIRARTRAVAQVQANIDEEQIKGSLKVVNANPDSLLSIFTDRAQTGSPEAVPHSAGGGLPRASPLSMSVQQNPMDDMIVIREEIPKQPILPPPTLRMNTSNTVLIRAPEVLQALEGGNDESLTQGSTQCLSPYPMRAPLPAASSNSALMGNVVNGKPFKPSLETVEKSVATKVYLENHYYGILKRPRDRDQRRAALERELANTSMTDAQRRKIRAAWTLSESEHLRNLRTRMSPSAFTKIKTIGHGAFGVVSLVRERGNGELYAMKQLRKADMLRKGQEGHVKAERDVMSAASSSNSSRWIVRLVYSFQDVDHLYLVMEYMGGGDLLNLLIETDIFEEPFARFYVAEMALAIQEAHKLGYIHRDIKPDNFIFTSDGHIKLSDFGLATDLHWAHDGAYYEEQRRQLLRKHGIDLEDASGLNSGKRLHNDAMSGLNLADLPLVEDDKGQKDGGVLTIRDKQRKKLAYSVVGTNSYMSPEVIRGTGYDQSCDWWSLGIIMFECLYGFPPFVSKTRHQTRQKILTWRTSLRFPTSPKVSRDAQDLITRLICEREDRLGSRSIPNSSRPNAVVAQQRRSGFLGPSPGFAGLGDGADDLKAHPWFRGVDFATLHLQEPPFKPNLKDAADTRYFDEDIEAEPLLAPDAKPGQADTTKDPMLRDKVHGKHLLDVRKQLAFQGYTFKSPRQKDFNSRRGLVDLAQQFDVQEDSRGRAAQREPSSGFRRAMSL